MQLNKLTETELDLIIQGIVLQFDYIEPIDDDYNLKVRAYILNNNMINITSTWCVGNHEYNDDQYMFTSVEFKVNKDANLRKLTKELNDVLNVVIAKAYNSEMQDFDFKDEY
jgi:hypothetical protein